MNVFSTACNLCVLHNRVIGIFLDPLAKMTGFILHICGESCFALLLIPEKLMALEKKLAAIYSGSSHLIVGVSLQGP